MDRPIPAFYCCYLLRSTVRHQNLYVGSTPNPVRRLRQHNGIAKGGAVRTSRDSLRPWEMTCLVTGFPSKIAALQFEWAWQNTHLTRHIAADDRFTQARSKVSPKTGKTRKRAGRPRMSLTDKLTNLHILLRARSFERWPLEVRFFAEDVYKMWARCTAKLPEKVREGVTIAMDGSIEKKGDLVVDERPVGIHALDVTFQPAKSILEKGRSLLAGGNIGCAICKSTMNPIDSLFLICPAQVCSSLSHLGCLSRSFLDAEPTSDAVVPTEGHCPSCRTKLRWTDLVRDLSLRLRGQKEVTALFKERRGRKKAIAEALGATLSAEEDGSENGTSDDEAFADIDGLQTASHSEIPDFDELQTGSEDDSWHNIDDINAKADNSLDGPHQNAQNIPKETSKQTAKRASRVNVIEDSDWDEAEVID